MRSSRVLEGVLLRSLVLLSNERAPAIALTVVRAALSRQALQALCLERSGAARWLRAPLIDGVRWPFGLRSPAYKASALQLAKNP